SSHPVLSEGPRNMKRTAPLLLAVGLACALGEYSPVAAQYAGYGPGYTPAYSRPYVSPYLNLLRGGQPAGVNYYALVRPEFTAQSQFNTLRQQTGLNAQAITGLQQQGQLPALVTGHQVGFMTQGIYFQSLGAAGYGGTGGPGFTIGGLTGAAGGQGYQ